MYLPELKYKSEQDVEEMSKKIRDLLVTNKFSLYEIKIILEDVEYQLTRDYSFTERL